MKCLALPCAVLLALATTPVHAITDHDKLELGGVVQGGIGTGTFTKPIPLPRGDWVLVAKKTEDIPLSNRAGDAGKVSVLNLIFKNSDVAANPIVSVAVSFSLNKSNVNWPNGKCEAPNANILIDTFGTNPSSLLYLCGRAFAFGGSFNKIVRGAPDNPNAWIKASLAPLSPFADEMPEKVYIQSFSGSRYTGRLISYSLTFKRDGAIPADAKYSEYVIGQMHTNGLVVQKVLEGSEAGFEPTQPYISKD